MPLVMIKTGGTGVIKKIGGKEETKIFLESLGFVVGSIVTVIAEMGEDMNYLNAKQMRR